jgi:hypothetical protein
VGVTFSAPTFLRRHHDLTAGEAAALFGFAALSGGWIAARGPDKLAHLRHVKLRIAANGSLSGIVLLIVDAGVCPDARVHQVPAAHGRRCWVGRGRTYPDVAADQLE